MAGNINLSSIIKSFSEKQKSAFIDFQEFCTYIKKYAEHHLEEQDDLVKYLDNPVETVTTEIQGLAEKHVATLITQNKKQLIVCPSFFVAKFSARFNDILENETLPFPIVAEFPKEFPVALLEQKDAREYISNALSSQDIKNQSLYILTFNHEHPSLVLPACVPINTVVEAAKRKILRLLDREETHDYFLQKLRTSNAGKEISIQTFFKNFTGGRFCIENINDLLSSDDYYYMGQLCFFIKQDFEKIKEKTVEDINILQAVEITEIFNTYLKQKMQDQIQRAQALKSLEENLQKSPYVFTMDQILKFKDESGKLLYGQFSEEDLKNFLQEKTTSSQDKELPEILNFKVASGTRYFIYKSKVITLTVRLCNEAHNSIGQIIEKRWYEKLYKYEKLPEMTDPKAFEKCLASAVEEHSPILWALINANFMVLLSYEHGADFIDNARIFSDNRILPYKDLLILKQDQIYHSAKIKLPFWYVVPILSWIVSVFAKKKKNPEKKNVETPKGFEEIDENSSKPQSKREKISSMATEITHELIPEGSTIDRELDFLKTQWNRMLTTESQVELTEDVNALIRDYMRRVISTLSASTFSADRIKDLARTLVHTPNMQRIKNDEALTQYVELYMLKLITNR